MAFLGTACFVRPGLLPLILEQVRGVAEWELDDAQAGVAQGFAAGSAVVLPVVPRELVAAVVASLELTAVLADVAARKGVIVRHL